MLHENSNVTTDECVLQLLDFYVKHNIMKIALQQLLQMQLNILPADNQLPKTVYKLFQYAQNIAPVCRVIKHYYCRKCLFNSKSQMIKKKITFECSICATTNSKDFSFFHEFDIGDQIRILFENYNLAEKLKKPTLQNVDNISDIVDGSEYIRVNSRNQRGNFDLTLILNTDGLALVKSAKSHCWPVLFIIAELPQDIRDKYVIFSGLWYDNLIKPPMNVFLMPICLKLKKYFCKGIDWTNPKTKEIVITKIVAPLVIADAPARAQLQNILNFNGRYGCNICEIRMVKCTKIAGKKTVRCYPFRIDSKIRTGGRMEAQAEKLRQLENKDQIRGVKGYSILSCLPLIDIGTCVIPEYMHSVLLGVVNQFMTIWFDKKGPWNIKNKSEDIDKFMCNIRVPQSFSRLPRQLSHFKLYKASENYNFLLFYSLPALVDHLPQKYLEHWLLLVISIFNLVRTTITQDYLEESDNLLQLFVSQIESLYGDRALSYNCHQLIHLPLCVKRWGPLRSTSAFVFENYNGFIAKCVHGNRNFGQEIVNCVQIGQGIQMLKNRIAERGDVTARTNQSKNYELLGHEIIKKELDVVERNILLSNGWEFENLSIYTRIKVNKVIYTSEIYKVTKTNSHTVQIDTNDFTVYGSIKFFV
ncbi:GSCOCG00011837001-RA-CDS [Cotesia congregata]|nr:GSCOCG00011837001-RA-CDS [Cotesia congregata]